MDSEFWNDGFKGNPDHVDVADRVLGPAIAGLSPGRALDLGCGSGRNALMLAERGWDTVGVDWAEHAVELATKQAQRRGLPATFVVGDTTSWRAEAPFDLVISTYALPGGEGNKAVLATAMRSVAPGGSLLIAEWDRSMAEVWPFEAADLVTVDELVAQLPGFEVEQAEMRRVEVFSKDDPRAFAGTDANIVVVRARRPTAT